MQCPTMASKCACPVLSVLAGHTSSGMKLRALPASHKGSKDRNEYAARRSVVPEQVCRRHAVVSFVGPVNTPLSAIIPCKAEDSTTHESSWILAWA